jgi:hypothetical protein
MIGLLSAQVIISDNHLQIKGKILNGYSADITIYEYSGFNEEWVLVYDKKNKGNYNLKVNPQVNSQIHFTNNIGEVKILHIDAGKKGTWEKIIDIDFNRKSIKYVKFYQVVNDYNLQRVSKRYICTKSKDDDNTDIPDSENVNPLLTKHSEQ